MTAYRFDDRAVAWRKLDNLAFFAFAVLDIDAERHAADVLFKFEPHRPIILHRHKALNKTFVIQGEHRLYHADGSLREVRPVGSYTVSPAHPDPHRECGGDDGAVVLFRIYGSGLLYELLDDDGHTVATLAFQDLAALAQTDAARA